MDLSILLFKLLNTFSGTACFMIDAIFELVSSMGAVAWFFKFYFIQSVHLCVNNEAY